MKTIWSVIKLCVVLVIVYQYSWALDSLYVNRISVCYTHEQAYDVKLLGNYAYVANDDSGLRVIDISDLSNRLLVGRYNSPHWSQKVFASDTFAYVAARDSGLRIVSIANPSAPVFIGAHTAGGTVRGVFVRDTIAYLAADAAGLVIMNIANPASPTILGSYVPTGTGLAYSVRVVDSVAYLADGANGLITINVANPASPQLMGTLPIHNSENCLDVVIDSNKAFLASVSGPRQYIVDISNPAAPFYTDSISLNTSRSLAKQDSFLFYAGSDSGLYIVSYTNGSHPILQGFNHRMRVSPGFARGVAVRDTYAFVAADSSGLVIYNFARIFTQQHLSIVSPTARDTLHSRDYTTIRWSIMNVSDSVKIQISRSSPVSWQTIGRAAAADTQFVWRVFNPVFIASTACIIRVVSLSDTTVLGTTPAFQMRGPRTPITFVSPVGGEVWAQGEDHTIRWLHSDSIRVLVGALRGTQISRFGSSTADSFVWTVSGDTSTHAYIRLAQYPDSIYIILSQPIVIQFNDVPEPVVPKEFHLSAAYPNPFNPTTTIRYAVPRACKLAVAVYDIRGATVSETTQEITSPGEYHITLNGENWSSGVYFVNIQAGTNRGMQKVVLIK